MKKLYRSELNNTETSGNLIHLCLPIGNQKRVEEFFCEKFKKSKEVFIRFSH
jgi:hypothetical protein